jgi:hypothetical protein
VLLPCIVVLCDAEDLVDYSQAKQNEDLHLDEVVPLT